MAISRERLSDLLVEPREDLDCEVKNWLDLQGSREDKATFAKAVLALANHGGGFVILGMAEIGGRVVEAEGRPATLDAYTQDQINGIVQYYCDPTFHCAVHIVANPAGAVFPVVVVPGGHRVPVLARHGGPNNTTVQNNAIYVRKSGPRSEVPQSPQEWEDLLARCFRNRRDEMFDQIRDLITGAVPQAQPTPEPDRLDGWIKESLERWHELIQPLPHDAGPRLLHGRYLFAYEIVGERKPIQMAQLPDVLRTSVVRHTGWPPFWYPSRNEIAPYLVDGAVECWMGGDTQTPPQQRDSAYSDFWRIRPDGFAFLLRGFQEDGRDREQPGRAAIAPGTAFDLTFPVWRCGEALLHASRLASHLFEGPTTIQFLARYEGLAGRTLISMNNSRHVWENDVARQDSIVLKTHVDAQAILPNLPEIVHPFLSPLYALFNFFELPMQLVKEELARMRGSRG